LIFLKVKLLFCVPFLLEKCLLDREENQMVESTSTWIRGDRQITETTRKNCVSLTLIFIYLLIIFPRNLIDACHLGLQTYSSFNIDIVLFTCS
jgi:hypothetical protein